MREQPASHADRLQADLSSLSEILRHYRGGTDDDAIQALSDDAKGACGELEAIALRLDAEPDAKPTQRELVQIQSATALLEGIMAHVTNLQREYLADYRG